MLLHKLMSDNITISLFMEMEIDILISTEEKVFVTQKAA